MGPLIIALIITWAFKHAWDHSRDDFGKSKTAHRQKQPKGSKPKRAAELVHHDIGYWTHQGTHGFPAFRHGFGKGWHEARQKAARARAERERARTEHLEAAADLEPEITDHHRRQAEARDRIREARQPEEGSGEGSTGAPGVTEPSSRQEANGDNMDNTRCGHCDARLLSNGICSQCQEPPERCQCAPLNDPASRHYGFLTWKEREAELQEGKPRPAVPPQGPQRPQEPQALPVTTKGDGTMPAAADTTYNGVLSSVAGARNVAEGHAAEAQQASRKAAAMSDQMQALEVDPATLSAMADHLDAHEAAVSAQRRVMETAGSVEAALKRGHQALAEAHQNAPVEAAEKQFYAA